MNLFIKSLLIIFLSFTVAACGNSPTIPAVASSDSNSDNSNQGTQKPRAPEKDKLSFSIFSFDNLGTHIFDEIREPFLAERIKKEMYDQNDILIFNNINGATGVQRFLNIQRRIFGKSKVLRCVSNYDKNTGSSKIVICANSFFALGPATNRKNYSIKELEINGELKGQSFSAPIAGHHAIIGMNTGVKFNLVAINLMKNNSFVVGHQVRSQQIKGLVSYMKSDLVKDDFANLPTVIIGDLQNTENYELANALKELKKANSLKVFSPFGRTVIDKEKDLVFNHLFYSSSNWTEISADIGGKCNNSTNKEKSNYQTLESEYCSSSFELGMKEDL